MRCTTVPAVMAVLVLAATARGAVLRGNGRSAAELPTFPNIKYLGLGYNVVTGNPFTNGADPGFAPEARQQMLKLTFTEGRQYDNQYAVPDGMNVINDASCSYTTATSTATSASDYQKALQTQMSFSAGADDWFVKFEFSASADYQSFVSNNEKQDEVQVSATAHCSAYGADVDAFGWTPTFTDEFQGAVRALGESLEYGGFIKLFGTHYVKGMQMGGTSTYAASMKSSSLAEMKRTGVDVSVGASLSFFVKVGADVSHSSKVSDYKAFSSAVTSDTLSGIPEPAPQCGGTMCSDYSAWSSAVTANPQPVNIKLASIVDILTPANFPHDGNITTKATALAAFLTDDYCGTVPGCAPAPPPPPAPPAAAIVLEVPKGTTAVTSTVSATVTQNSTTTFTVSLTGADQVVTIWPLNTDTHTFNMFTISLSLSPSGWQAGVDGRGIGNVDLDCGDIPATQFGSTATFRCNWGSSAGETYSSSVMVHL